MGREVARARMPSRARREMMGLRLVGVEGFDGVGYGVDA